MKGRTVGALVALVVLVMAAGACSTDPPAQPGDAWSQYVGHCYTIGSSTSPVAEVAYTGPMNALGNAKWRQPSGGTCTGPVWSGPAGTNALVQATSFAQAQSMCNALDPSTIYSPFLASDFFPGENAWTCVG